MSSPTQFSSDLTIPFQQGSFDVGIPTFGGFNPAAGVQGGIAILSDLEAFFFIQAAQGDQRTNLLFAPKVTLFNGQSATVTDNRARPFVTSLVPTVGFGSVGYTPQITTINEGITLTATAVVSADRRFVRLTLIPFFRSITDVFTFQVSGAGSGGQSGQGQGQGGFGGGQFGGGGGGQGGGQGGGGGVGGGQFGIGGGLGSMQIMQTLFTQGQFGGIGGGGGQIGGGGQVGGQQGQAGQQGQGGGGGAAITVQQPVVETVNVSTTVSVPDGGTVLMGGIKRLKEGRTMSGVPILNKIPYVSRLFKNSGVGRETESLMLMITPRIIIQEEEEELQVFHGTENNRGKNEQTQVTLDRHRPADNRLQPNVLSDSADVTIQEYSLTLRDNHRRLCRSPRRRDPTGVGSRRFFLLGCLFCKRFHEL